MFSSQNNFEIILFDQLLMLVVLLSGFCTLGGHAIMV